jgi:hypothetical protein
MNWSWMAAIVFVAATGLVGLSATLSPQASYRSPRWLLLVAATVVLPAALLAGLLFGS